jgi:ligand-binding sensor domain-containing protein/two-component sensor histidine kinase
MNEENLFASFFKERFLPWRPILFAFFGLTPLSLLSQDDYLFEHLTVEDGLLSNPHVHTFQDSEGYYWFSSTSGIQRFDGRKFVSYLYSDNGKKYSSGEWVGKPVEDRQKNIWILNDDGINIYDKRIQKLGRVFLSDAPDSNSRNVCDLLKDEQQNIWIITNRNIFRYDYATKKPILINRVISETNFGIATVCFDQQASVFWLLISGNSSFRVASYNYKTGQVSYTSNDRLIDLLHHYNPISFFKMDKQSNIWIADYLGHLSKFNTISQELINYSPLPGVHQKKKSAPNANIQDFLDEGNGTIWFGGEDIGLLKYTSHDNRFTNIEVENGSQYGLHYDQTVFGFFKDREGNIWINTDLGMNIFNPMVQQFKYLNQEPALSPQFSANVTSIFESTSKDIWISTFGNGVFRYDSNFVFQSNYLHDKNNPNSLGEPLNRTWSFAEDDKKRIWVGSQYGMLSIFDPATGVFTSRIVPEFNRFTIMHMSRDDHHNLWFGLYNGMLGKWNAGSSSIKVFPDLYGEDCKAATIIDGLLVDNNSAVFAATSSYGLDRFNEANKSMDEKVAFPQHVFMPASLNDSVIVAGTSGKGLLLFNKLTKATRFFNTSSGLSSNIVLGALPGKLNNIWVIASDAIEKLNLQNGKIVQYNLSDGIKDHVFLKAFYKLKSGLLMVAANSGILYFNPDSIQARPPPPDVLITDFSAGRQVFPVDSLLNLKSVDLSADQNVITIEYAAVSFKGRRIDQYCYQLKGIDHDWVSAETHRAVTYANLSPGDYVFEVKAKNPDGAETIHTTSIGFTIHPPWRRTWWAYLLWSLLLFALGFTVVDYRKRSRQSLSDMRQRIATDLHDDIGSTLNSISVYSEIAGRDLQTNTGNTKRLLEKMGQTSRNMIDTMNDIVWAVNPKNDHFENIVERMRYFAGELLSGKNILLQFEIEDNVKSIKLPMEKRKNFYLIFKEAITNAYKYSRSKKVSVTIMLEGQSIIMVIADDGQGFETQDKTSGGNGLKNMQARAKEIAASLDITTKPGQGSKIELRMPV